MKGEFIAEACTRTTDDGLAFHRPFSTPLARMPSRSASARPNHLADGESAGDPCADHHDGRDDEEAAVRSVVLHDVSVPQGHATDIVTSGRAQPPSNELRFAANATTRVARRDRR